EGWFHYDMTIGAAHDTLGAIALHVLRALAPQHPSLPAFKTLNDSRLGLFAVRGREETCAILEDLATGWCGAAEVPSGYRGRTGAVWLTRLLPDPRDATRAVSWTTPYEIRSPSEEALRRYLERTVPT